MESAINYFDFEKRCELFDDPAKRTAVVNEYVWGNSVIKIGDTYHAYIERWDNVDGLNGYVYYGKLYHATSSDRLGPFTTMTELTELKIQTWSAGAVFNGVPIVIGNTIYLYYCGTTVETPTYPLIGTPARDNMRIGVAYTDISTPEGPFTVLPGNPILSPRASEWDELMTTNPFPYIARDGSLKMVYKSCTIADPNVLILGIASAEDPLGPWMNAPAQITSVTNIEESAVWREGEFFYMISKGQDATYVPVNNGILLYSKTGNEDDWHLVTSNTRAYRLTLCNNLLQSSLRSRMERPFVLVENGKAVAFYLAIMASDNLTSFNMGKLIKQ